MTSTTTMTLFDSATNNKVAHVTYYLNPDDKEVFVGYLDVMPDAQGQGFGKMMMILMLADLMSDVEVRYIRLDDCSDLALQKRSLYFKLGFRIANASNPETMTVFLGTGESENNVKLNVNYYTYENGSKPVSNVYTNVGDFVASIVGRYALDKRKITWSEFGAKYYLQKNKEQGNYLDLMLKKLNDVKLIQYTPRMCRH
jgi:GNAT superfamily N-acetyltransferase